jgi:integrase
LAKWRGQLSGTPLDIFDTRIRTAVRLYECLRLRRDDYDPFKKTFHISNPREQRAADIPVSRHAQDIVERRLGGKWLFPCGSGKPYAVSGIRSILYRARDRVG